MARRPARDDRRGRAGAAGHAVGGPGGVDVALDLVEAGHFGGASLTPAIFAADAGLASLYFGPWIAATVVATVLIVRAVRRRRASQLQRSGYNP